MPERSCFQNSSARSMFIPLQPAIWNVVTETLWEQLQYDASNQTLLKQTIFTSIELRSASPVGTRYTLHPQRIPGCLKYGNILEHGHVPLTVMCRCTIVCISLFSFSLTFG